MKGVISYVKGIKSVKKIKKCVIISTEERPRQFRKI